MKAIRLRNVHDTRTRSFPVTNCSKLLEVSCSTPEAATVERSERRLSLCPMVISMRTYRCHQVVFESSMVEGSRTGYIDRTLLLLVGRHLRRSSCIRAHVRIRAPATKPFPTNTTGLRCTRRNEWVSTPNTPTFVPSHLQVAQAG